MPTLHHSVFYRPDALPVNRFVFTINMQNVTLMHSCRWGRGWVWKSHGDRTDWDGGSGDGDGVQMGKRNYGDGRGRGSFTVPMHLSSSHARRY